jgi:hypothetical protein
MSAENSSSGSARRASIRPVGPTVAELAQREGLTTEEFLHRQLANLLKMQEAERKLRLENERKELVKEQRRLKARQEEISRRIDEIDRDN